MPRYNPELRSRAVDLYRAGHTVREIAAMKEMPVYDTVRQWLVRENVRVVLRASPLPSKIRAAKRRLAMGVPLKWVADDLKVSPKKLKRLIAALDGEGEC